MSWYWKRDLRVKNEGDDDIWEAYDEKDSAKIEKAYPFITTPTQITPNPSTAVHSAHCSTPSGSVG